MLEPNQNEHALIEQAKHNTEAFGHLYDLHVDKIYNFIYYRTGNRHEAEDLTARIFFRAIHHIDRYEDNGAPFAAWLYSIARNMLANWYRDQSKRTMVSLDERPVQPAGQSPEVESENEEDRQALLAAIRRLPADRQELLILKHVDRLSNVEIAQIMGHSEGAIKSLYFRTLKSLRIELDREITPERVNARDSGLQRMPGVSESTEYQGKQPKAIIRPQY